MNFIISFLSLRWTSVTQLWMTMTLLGFFCNIVLFKEAIWNLGVLRTMNLHQVLTGAVNPGDNCFSVGSIDNVPFTVRKPCGCDCDTSIIVYGTMATSRRSEDFILLYGQKSISGCFLSPSFRSLPRWLSAGSWHAFHSHPFKCISLQG